MISKYNQSEFLITHPEQPRPFELLLSPKVLSSAISSSTSKHSNIQTSKHTHFDCTIYQALTPKTLLQTHLHRHTKWPVNAADPQHLRAAPPQDRPLPQPDPPPQPSKPAHPPPQLLPQLKPRMLLPQPKLRLLPRARDQVSSDRWPRQLRTLSPRKVPSRYR